jgi:ParB family chromosome partitioning protein
MTSNQTTIALSCLVASTGNVRTSESRTLESLAQSIVSVGLLQNLVVVQCEGKKRASLYEVAAGGRRFAALQLLADRGQIAADFGVPCIVRDRADLTTVSLTENVQREQMNPADEIAAFAKLIGDGQSIDAIADAFGVTPLVVERRLALAKASPKLVDLLRAGKMTTEQLRALCATEDHARQESVWESSWNKDPVALRRNVVGEAIEANKDKRVLFIGGIEAYEQAGGQVRRDLFSNAESSGFIDDAALLDRLVAAKLESHAETLRADGWAWVEIQPAFDWTAFNRLGKINAVLGALTDAQVDRMNVLDGEKATLSAELEGMQESEGGERTQEEHDRMEAIETQLEAIDDESGEITNSAKTYKPKAKATAGCIVALENGALRIERGLVKADDRKAAAAAGGKVLGGRETNAAGRKPNALSDALERSLHAHRNIAVQSETAKNVHVSKVIMACWTVGKIRGSHGAERGPTDLQVRMAYGMQQAVGSMGEDVQARAASFDAEGKALVKGLPSKAADLWDALIAYTDAQLDALNAYGVALTVALETGHKGLTGKLIASLDFDMAQHFDATAANYLGRNLKKDQIVVALADVGKADDKAALLKMKTRELASEAEHRLKGTGWVPSLIRTPAATPEAPKAKATAKGAKAKTATAKNAKTGKTSAR